MKKTFGRMLRPALSVVLTLIMVLGVFTPALAMEARNIKLVSLGDSMANGYGLEGYGNQNGYHDYGVAAYANQLADWLEDNGAVVEHSQLAMSAMRAEDLHFILEYGTEGAYPGDKYTEVEFEKGRFVDNIGSVEKAATEFQTSVAEADIITLGAGNANFGVFLLHRIVTALEFGIGAYATYDWISVEDALAECDEETKAIAMQVYEEVKAELMTYVPAEKAEKAEELAEIFTYATISYMLSYAGIIETIYNLNPDAEVILMGLMNSIL